jgi:dsRNA-specific ribonuclease
MSGERLYMPAKNQIVPVQSKKRDMSDVAEKSENDQLWVSRLKKLISKILLNILPTEDLEYYFDDDAMKIWILAFTNETYSPSENNEDLEYLGDAILKSVFPKWLMKKFPKLHKNDYTELNTRYMSKMEQGELGYELGFGKKGDKNYHMIRTKGVGLITINLVADAFEAFFGALDTISDNIREGLGYINCYNMINYLFKNKKITDSGSHAKTQIQQLFTRFELPKPVEISDEGKEIQITLSPKLILYLKQNKMKYYDSLSDSNSKKDAYKQAIFSLQKLDLIRINEIEQSNKNKYKDNQLFDIRLTRSHLNFLEGIGISLSNNIIGHAEAPTKKDAEAKAYKNALDFLANIKVETAPEGITSDWAEKYKLALDISHPKIKQFLPALGEKLSKEKYVSFEFVTPAKTSEKKNALMQLIGIKASGDKHVLSSTKVDQKDRKNGNIIARALLMEKYLNS